MVSISCPERHGVCGNVHTSCKKKIVEIDTPWKLKFCIITTYYSNEQVFLDLCLPLMSNGGLRVIDISQHATIGVTRDV